MYPQYMYTAKFQGDKTISSKVEFIVTNSQSHMLLIVEDDEGLCSQYRWAFPACEVLMAHARASACNAHFEQHAHFRKAARQDELLDDLQETRLIVEIGLEIGCVDGNQAAGSAGDLVHSRTHLRKRRQNTKCFRTLAR